MKIYEFYTDKSKWTKGAEARDFEGHFVFFDAPEAICFCLFGAIYKCYPDDKEREAVREKIQTKINPQLITDWNDQPERNFTEVKQLALDLDI